MGQHDLRAHDLRLGKEALTGLLVPGMVQGD